jgi:hypothetical protein
MEFNKNQKAVLATLLYSDIFDFPLTIDELHSNLIASPPYHSHTLLCHSREGRRCPEGYGNPAPPKYKSESPIDINTLQKTLKSLHPVISEKKGFYCLAGKENSIEKRIQRLKYANNKLKIAKNISKHLSHIPTIYFIGLTGRLAHNDADENDDIDLFLITKKNTMWTTRVAILAILELTNTRRKPNETNPANKICANLIIEETALHWPHEKHDIYTAHEIINMQPLFDRNNIYRKFLSSNNWISQFYPNHDSRLCHSREGRRCPEGYGNPAPPKHNIIINTINLLFTLPLTEFILEKLQRIYMKKKITNETILTNFLAFHPHDYRQEILKNFTNKIKQYGL